MEFTRLLAASSVFFTVSLASPLPASPFALTAPTPTLPHLFARNSLFARNGAAVPTGSGNPTITHGPTAAERASAPLSSASASTTAVYDNPVYNNFFGAGIPSSMLIYVAAAIASGILLSLLIARYFFIKRHYPPTLRAYFIPLSGIHIPWLRISIDAPPPRPPRGHPPSYSLNAITRRRRRDRTTRGEGIGEGGVRRGERDADDGFDGEQTVGGGEEDGLPMYQMDTGLPAYGVADTQEGERDRPAGEVGGGASEGGSTTAAGVPATSAGATSTAAEDVLPSVQDYEQATRQARLANNASRPPLSSPTTLFGRAPSYNATPTQHPSALSSEATIESGGGGRPSASRTPSGEADRSSTFTLASSSHTKVEDLDEVKEGDGKDVGEERMLEQEEKDEGAKEVETEMIERVPDPEGRREE